MVKDAILSAFGGESMAHMRYLIYSDIARREGYNNVAKLFEAIAYAEYVHARNHYRRLRGLVEDARVYAGAPIGPGNTLQNLGHAINGEAYEVREMYPVFIRVAEFQGDEAAAKSFRWALEAEKIHLDLYGEAKKYVEKGVDWRLGKKIWICSVCGHTYIGDSPPDRCPVCGSPSKVYREF